MARVNNLTDFLTDVADAIREKKGTTEPINASDFDTEIQNLPSGGEDSIEDIIKFAELLEYPKVMTEDKYTEEEQIKVSNMIEHFENLERNDINE